MEHDGTTGALVPRHIAISLWENADWGTKLITVNQLATIVRPFPTRHLVTSPSQAASSPLLGSRRAVLECLVVPWFCNHLKGFLWQLEDHPTNRKSINLVSKSPFFMAYPIYKWIKTYSNYGHWPLMICVILQATENGRSWVQKALDLPPFCELELFVDDRLW
jgi:hypothetical protein